METNQNQETSPRDHTEEPKYRTPKVQNFRTLQQDIIGTTQKKDASLAGVVLSANEKRWAALKGEEVGLQKVGLENQYGRPSYKILLVAIVVIIGLLVGLKLYVFNTPEITPASEPQTLLDHLSLDVIHDVNIVDIGTSTIADRVLVEQEFLSARRGEYVGYTLVLPSTQNPDDNQALSMEEFLALWDIDLPALLRTQIEQADYVLGEHIGEQKTSFIALTLTNTPENRAQLKTWESTLGTDVQKVFLHQKTPLEGTSFVDGVVGSSTTVRILEYIEGEPLVVYGFIKDDILIISNETELFTKNFSL